MLKELTDRIAAVEKKPKSPGYKAGKLTGRGYVATGEKVPKVLRPHFVVLHQLADEIEKAKKIRVLVDRTAALETLSHLKGTLKDATAREFERAGLFGDGGAVTIDEEWNIYDDRSPRSSGIGLGAGELPPLLGMMLMDAVFGGGAGSPFGDLFGTPLGGSRDPVLASVHAALEKAKGGDDSDLDAAAKAFVEAGHGADNLAPKEACQTGEECSLHRKGGFLERVRKLEAGPDSGES